MSTAQSLSSLEADTFFGYIDRQTLSERIQNPSLCLLYTSDAADE